VAQRAVSGRIMGSRRKLLFRVTSRTSRAAAVVMVAVRVMVAVMATAVTDMGHRIRTRQRTPKVTAVEDSPAFQGSLVNFPTSLVVLGMEEGKAPEKRFHKLARMPLHMRLPSRRIGLFRSPAQTRLLYTRRLTRHPMPQTSLSHLEEATNLLTTHPRDSSGLVVELERTSTVASGVERLGNANHEPRTTKRTRMMDVTPGPQRSPTLDEVTDSRQTR
jgi:hypothetical protein